MEMHRQAYIEETRELLGELEIALLELEEKPNDENLIGRVFRAMHTIKGSGAMFGFDGIAEFTHEVETVFDLVRRGELTVNRELTNLALSARDHIREMLESGEDSVDEHRSKEIISFFKSLIPEETLKKDESPEASYEAEPAFTCRIRFKPDEDIFLYGVNPILLLNETRELGNSHIIAHVDGIPFLEDINPEACYTRWDMILTTERGMDAIRDVFVFVEENCELKIDIIEGEGIPGDGAEYKRIGEIMVDRGDIAPEALEEFVSKQRPLGELLIEADMVGREAVEGALAEQEYIRTIRRRRDELTEVSSIRVASEKLDSLVNLVGELVTVQARLKQLASQKQDPDFVSVSEMVERLIGELRDNTMSIRMLPLGTTFNRFKRLVRDLSGTLGKKVDFSTEGGDTELDKTVLDRLNDPLVHIIRNSIDHGIESGEERESLGKPGHGKLLLSAEHSGANVFIRISDDGGGLNSKKIRAEAVKKGLIQNDAEMSEEEIFSLIFMPGMSTSGKITDISGRGVGMDVVKRSLDALGGSIEVDSARGKGVTFTLKLPLTLAIVDGLMVRIGDSNFIVPLSIVEECLELSMKEASVARERSMINFRGRVIPFIDLHEVFDLKRDNAAVVPAIVVEAGEKRVALEVDLVIGHHQTVLKPLGSFYKDIKGISGATILGDGTVALILDIPILVRSLEKYDGLETTEENGGPNFEDVAVL